MCWRWLNWPAPARRTATFAFFVFTIWLLLAPSRTFKEITDLFPFQDKVAHFGMFGVLSGLCRWSTSIRWSRGWRRAVFFLALVGYGACVECIQPHLPGAGRSFDWLDLLFDGIGVAAGIWLCERLVREA
jgi:hypothetical protein